MKARPKKRDPGPKKTFAGVFVRGRWRWLDPAEFTNPHVDGQSCDPKLGRAAVVPGYEALAAVHDEALNQAQAGKGIERHSKNGEAFPDQQIVQLGEWMGSTSFAVGQACKKALESTRLPYDRARAELLGAINYLSAAVIQLDRANKLDKDRW